MYDGKIIKNLTIFCQSSQCHGLVMVGISNVTGSVERAVHFVVLWIVPGVGVAVHLVGGILGQLGVVAVMAATQGAAGTRGPGRLGGQGRGAMGIVGGLGPIDHGDMAGSVVIIKPVLVMMLRPRGLLEWTLGLPGWARRSRGGRSVILLWVKVKYPRSETAVV